MAPYNIDRDTRLQHSLLDTATNDPSIILKLISALYALVIKIFNISTTLAFIALWAAAIYLLFKACYIASIWLGTSIRSYAQKNSLKTSQKNKDLESQYADTPDLSFTPDSVGSPLSVGSPALMSSPQIASGEALARSMKKLGIYVEHSAILPAPGGETPSKNTNQTSDNPRSLSDGYTEYSFMNEHAMIKTH